jgi:hypothetical protein
MAGFRFKIEEKALLVNVAKAALTDFEEKAKHAKTELEQYGLLHSADTMRGVVEKLERNTSEA